MHILVTGSNFITRNFEEKFSKKWELSYLPTEHLEDVRLISAAFKKNKFDVVLHLDGKRLDEEGSIGKNLTYFRNLQYACTLGRVSRLLYCITGEDRLGSVVQATEPDLERVQAADGAGCASQMVYELAKKDNFTTILRLGFVYGKYQRAEDNIIMSAVHSVCGGKKLKKLVVPADRRMSLTYVDDTIKLIGRIIADNKPKGTYNLVSDENPTLNDVAKLLQKALSKGGKELDIELATTTAPEYTLSNARIAVFFQDMDFVSARSGINKLLKMYGEDKMLVNLSL